MNLTPILKSYGIKKEKIVKEKGGWSRADVYRVNGKYLLKVYPRLTAKEVEELRFEMKLLHFLHKKGCKVPNSYEHNHHYCTQQQGCTFLLLDYLPGKNEPSISIPAAAREHATLLKAMQLFRGKVRDWGRWEKYVASLYKDFPSLPIIKETRELYTEFKQLPFSKLRRGVIHGDFRSANLIGKTAITGIIDFGNTRKDYLLYDVAKSCMSFGYEKKATKNYLAELQKKFPLTKEEKKALYLFMQMVNVEISVFFHKKKNKKYGAYFRKRVKFYQKTF